MSDPDKTHAIEHAFVQINTSRDPVDYQQRNNAARSAASKSGLPSAAAHDPLKSSVGETRTPGASISDSSSTGLMRMATKYWHHSRSPPTEGKKASDIKETMSVPVNTDSANNVIIMVAAEVDYEFRIPNRATYPQQVSIPLMMRIHVSSVSESDLPELQPILPWPANPSDATTYDGANGPALWLDLHLESLVENQTRVEKWWGLRWRNTETPRDNAQWAFSPYRSRTRLENGLKVRWYAPGSSPRLTASPRSTCASLNRTSNCPSNAVLVVKTSKSSFRACRGLRADIEVPQVHRMLTMHASLAIYYVFMEPNHRLLTIWSHRHPPKDPTFPNLWPHEVCNPGSLLAARGRSIDINVGGQDMH